MKKSGLIKFFSIFLVVILFLPTNNIFASDTTKTREKLLNSYSGLSYEQLKLEYDQALKENDKTKQEVLIFLGSIELKKLVEELKVLDVKTLSRSVLSRSSYYSFNDFFESGQWITRDLVALSLRHKNVYSWSSNDDGSYSVVDAWRTVKNKYSSDYRWRESTMYEQFICHFTFAQWKNPWNLEPSRTNINPFTCN